jgi:outer membrane protein assembly factor BamB
MDTSKVDGDHPDGLDVYYLTALDFRTGEVVWEKQVGTGFNFDHWYTTVGVGPDDTVYFGLYGGIVSVRDLY